MKQGYKVIWTANNGYGCGCCYRSWSESEDFETRDEALKFSADLILHQEICDNNLLNKVNLDLLDLEEDYIDYLKKRAQLFYGEHKIENIDIIEFNEFPHFDEYKEGYLKRSLKKFVERSEQYYKKEKESKKKREERQYQQYLSLKKKFED